MTSRLLYEVYSTCTLSTIRTYEPVHTGNVDKELLPEVGKFTSIDTYPFAAHVGLTVTVKGEKPLRTSNNTRKRVSSDKRFRGCASCRDLIGFTSVPFPGSASTQSWCWRLCADILLILLHQYRRVACFIRLSICQNDTPTASARLQSSTPGSILLLL